MGNWVTSIISETRIVPAVNNTFWEIIGNWFVSLGSILRDAIFNLLYVLCKFALNVIDFMQLLVQKLAGVDAWLHLESVNLENLRETDIVFRFLLSDTVQTVFRTMISLFLVLLIVFSIVAIIKNEYGAATSGKAVDHKQTWYNAFKAVITVALVPILLIGGILTSNAILAGLMKAFNVNSSLSLGGQIFMASAYDASDYRRYVSSGVRMPVSNMVKYHSHDGHDYYVDTQIDVIVPGDYKSDNRFYGYMFTFNGRDYFLWHVDNYEYEKACRKDYYYLKYILGAYIVEATPRHNVGAASVYEYYRNNYNNELSDNSDIATLVQRVYDNNHEGYLISESSGWMVNGYVLNSLNETDGGLLTAARNTWSYNQSLTTGISGWAENNSTIQVSPRSYTTVLGATRTASLVQNSQNWASLHDGGVDGFHPLAVEYQVMADVMDFAIGNNIKLYFVNSNNGMINYYIGSSESTTFDRNTLYDTMAGGTADGVEDGYLVEYKKEGRVAYPFSPVGAQSEAEGATYIVCYYDASTGTYIPLTNGVKMYDEYGDGYTFKSTKFADSYHGVIIARGLFKKTATWIGYLPTYIAQTMEISGNGISDFDDTDRISAVTQNTGYFYNYIEQLSNEDSTDYFAVDVTAENATYDKANFVYYSENNSLTREAVAETIANKFGLYGFSLYNSTAIDDATYGAGTFEEDDQFELELKYSTEYQKYILSFKFVAMEEVRKKGSNNLFAYKFEVEEPKAFGYTSALAFVNTPKQVVSGDGYEDYYVMYDSSEEKAFTFYASQNNVITNQFASGAIQNALLQVVGNTQYSVLSVTATSAGDGTGKITYVLYETATADASGNYVSGSKQYTVELNENVSASVQDGLYAHHFLVTVSTDELQLDKFVAFNEVLGSSANYTAANIGTNAKDSENSLTKYYDSTIYYISDNSHFDTVAHAYNSTIKIAEHIRNLYARDNYSVDALNEKTVMISAAGIDQYAGEFLLVVNRTDGEDSQFKIKVSVELKSRIDTGKTIEVDGETEKVWERVISVSYEIQNTFKVHSTVGQEVEKTNFDADDEMDEGIPSQVLTLSDLERVGTSTLYNYYDKNAVQYKYSYSPIGGQTISVVLNAFAVGDANVDGGLIFVGYHKDGDKYVLNEIDSANHPISADGEAEKIQQVFYKLSEVRFVHAADYIASTKVDGGTKYYVLDLQNLGQYRARIYEVTIPDGKGVNLADANYIKNNVTIAVSEYTYNGSNYVKDNEFNVTESILNIARAYVRNHFDSGYEYFETKKFGQYSESGSTASGALQQYSTSLASIKGKNYTFYSTNIADSEETLTVEQIEKRFHTYLVTLTEGSVDYRTSNTADNTTTEQMLARFARNPVTVIFCRDDMEEHLLTFDVTFDISWTFAVVPIPHFTFRFHIGPTINRVNHNVSITKTGTGTEISDYTPSFNHKQVVSLKSGMLAIDYNFLGNVAVDNLYITYAINWLVLVIAIVIVFSILGKAVWGLIRRIYQITLLFLIMPAVASTIPLDGNGAKFGDWRKQVISEVLGAYGVCLGLNFFFIIMPVIRDASAIFTDADVTPKTLGMLGYVVNADMLNLLCYILFLLVALTLLKTVPGIISGFVGGNDVIKQGEETKKGVLSAVSEAGNAVSGKSALGAIENAKTMAFGEKDKKTGKRTGGLLTPGKAIVDDWKKKHDARKKKKEGDKKSVEEEREDFNKNAQHDDVANSLDSILNPPAEEPAATPATEAPAEEPAATPAAEAPVSDAAATESSTPETPTPETPVYTTGAGAEEEPKYTVDPDSMAGLTSTVTEEAANSFASFADQAGADNGNDANPAGEAGKGDKKSGTGEQAAFAKYAEASGRADTAREATDPDARSQIQTIAGAVSKVNDSASGKYHDYYGDKLKAEADAADYARSRTGKAEARFNEAQDAVDEQIARAAEGKGKRSHITAADIDAYNTEHAGDKDFIAMKKKGEKGYYSQEQKALRARLGQEKKIRELQNKVDRQKQIFEDAQQGIYRGLRGSFVRTFGSGKKTTEQRVKDAEALEKAEERKKRADAASRALAERDFANPNATYDELSKDERLKATAERVRRAFIDKEMSKSALAISQGMSPSVARAAAEKAFDSLDDKKKVEMLEKAVSRESGAATKAYDKALARASDERTGLAHNTAGRFVRFVAGKGSELAQYLSHEGQLDRKHTKAVGAEKLAREALREEYGKSKTLQAAVAEARQELAAASKKNSYIGMINQHLAQGPVSTMTKESRQEVARLIREGIKNGALQGTFIAEVYEKNGGKIKDTLQALHQDAYNRGAKNTNRIKGGGLMLHDNNVAESEAIKKLEAAERAFDEHKNGALKIARQNYDKAYKRRTNAYQAIKVNTMEEGSAKKRAEKVLKADVAETAGRVKKAKRIRARVENADERTAVAAEKAARKTAAKAATTAEKERIKGLRRVKNGAEIAGRQSDQNRTRTTSAMNRIGKATAERIERDAEQALNKKYRSDLNRIRGDMDRDMRARVDRELARERERMGRHRMRPEILERVIKNELEKKLRELNKNAANSGIDARVNAELNRVKNQLARITAANSSYSKRIKNLTESNKKLSRSVKSGKSASALEQQINHKNSFTGN